MDKSQNPLAFQTETRVLIRGRATPRLAKTEAPPEPPAASKPETSRRAAAVDRLNQD
jgi:hypothetical protein